MVFAGKYYLAVLVVLTVIEMAELHGNPLTQWPVLTTMLLPINKGWVTWQRDTKRFTRRPRR